MSTGYTFSAIQDYSEQLVKKLRLENIIEAPIVRKKNILFLIVYFCPLSKQITKECQKFFLIYLKKIALNLL